MEPEQSISVQTKTKEMTCWQCGRAFPGSTQVCPFDGTRLIALTIDEDYDPLLGQIIDDAYKLEARLGEGGMGTVYRCMDLNGSKQVAMKVLKADYLRDENIRRRFMDEARIIANLKHPNAVSMFDFGQMPDGNFYMIMELLQGESLAERLSYKFLSYKEILEIIPPMCEVLDEAHSMGIVHRDIKPENIYIQIDDDAIETPRLLDFGVAKQLENESFTRTGTLWGTPAYMSPEQARGDEVGAAADIYAIGIILYELIGGNLPFFASSQMGYAIKHMNEHPRSLLTMPGMQSVPKALDDLVLSTLAKNPADRPESMAELAQALRDIHTDHFDDTTLSLVPAEEVDPIALQEWIKAPDQARRTDSSLELFPGEFEFDEFTEKPVTPTNQNLSASASVEFSAFDQFDDSTSATVVASEKTPPTKPSNLRFIALGALVFFSMLAVGVLVQRQRQPATTFTVESVKKPNFIVKTTPAPKATTKVVPPVKEKKPTTMPPTEDSLKMMQLGALRAADVTVLTRVIAQTIAQPAKLSKPVIATSNKKRIRQPVRPIKRQSTPKDDKRSKINKALRKTF